MTGVQTCALPILNKAHFWVGKKADEAMIRAIASEPEYDIDKLMVSERECVKA